MTTAGELSAAHPLEAGRDALKRGRWEDARACFEAALARDETADALEALAMAAWWLDDAQVTIESRERAYRMRREDGELVGAARMATWLVWDYIAFRGEPAVANGWVQRAHRLLEGVEPAPEHGWLAIRKGEIAFMLENDVGAAHRFASEARAIGRSLGEGDLELSALALEGMALASEGEVTEGIRLLDEASAAAVAGEMSELWAVGRACCYLITACERVRDFERAAQWSVRMLEFAARWRIPHLFAVCRAHYAGVLVWRGTWPEAEAEFATALQEFSSTRPGMGFEAVVRLGELRRRQGRLDEAARLFGEVEFHPFAQLGLAAVALDRGDPTRAAEVTDRFLGGIGSDNPMQRIAGLELLVRALVASADYARARVKMDELDAVVADVGTDPLRASALAAEAALAAAEGDADTARLRCEDAIGLFQRSGAPFETAAVRMELARVLAGLGRREAAVEQARMARDVMGAMRAERAAEAAAVLVEELDTKEDSALTAREREVLRLVAQGLTNADIAEQLVLSEHTVHRHVANILTKLGLRSRAAAAAWGAQHGLV